MWYVGQGAHSHLEDASESPQGGFNRHFVSYNWLAAAWLQNARPYVGCPANMTWRFAVAEITKEKQRVKTSLV